MLAAWPPEDSQGHQDAASWQQWTALASNSSVLKQLVISKRQLMGGSPAASTVAFETRPSAQLCA